MEFKVSRLRKYFKTEVYTSYYHRGWSSVMVTPLTEYCELLDWSVAFPCEGVVGSLGFWVKNAGCEGTSRVIETLLSISKTEDMVGLSTMLFWTHSKPMCMHLSISALEAEGSTRSTRFQAFPSTQFFHAYENKYHILFRKGLFDLCCNKMMGEY